MKRIHCLFITLLIFALLAPAHAFAHTGLKSSIPENKQIVKEEVKEIKMVFNTDIEKLSSFTVKDDQGKGYKVSDIQADKSTLSGSLDQSLPNGAYTVNWKIIGRDGHPIKGNFIFSVEVPVVEAVSPSPTATSSPIETESISPTENATNSPSSSPSISAQPETDSEPTENASLDATSNASWILVVLAAVVFIAFVVSFIIRKNRKS